MLNSALVILLLPWILSWPAQPDSVELLIERSIDGSSGPWEQIGIVQHDTFYLDNTIYLEAYRVYWRLRARYVREDTLQSTFWGPPGLPVSGALVDLAPGLEPYRVDALYDSARGIRECLGTYRVPVAPIEQSWSGPCDTMREAYWMSYTWDINHDGWISLVDFSAFAKAWAGSLSDFAAFCQLYNRQTEYFFIIQDGDYHEAD